MCYYCTTKENTKGVDGEMITHLRKAMAEQNISGKELSAQTGINLSSIYKFTCGDRTPSVKDAKKIAAALGFDWTRFYEDPGEEVFSDVEAG